MHGVTLVVSDDHAGLKAARQAVMTGVPWQRCQFHTIQSAITHVPKVAMRSEVAPDLRRVFDADEPAEAERRLKDVVSRHQKTAPQLVAWLEHAIPEALTVLTVKPGIVRTPMTEGLAAARSPLAADADTVARDIERAILRRQDVVYTLWFWWPVMTVIGAIPEAIFKRLKL